MAHKFRPVFYALVCAMILLPAAHAGESKPAHGKPPGHHATEGKQHGHHAKQGKHKGHHFVPHWSKTLSDEQKARIDLLHLKLEQDLVILKAQEALREKELNVLTASGSAKQKDIYGKIDELMEVKKEIMRHRHDHLVEMRELLTPEQRLSYDMAILGRSGVK